MRSPGALRLAGALLLGTADWMGGRPEIPTRAHFCGCPDVPIPMGHGNGTAGRCRFRQCPEPGEVVTAVRLAQRCSGLYGPPCSFLERESRCPWLPTPRLPSPSQQAGMGPRNQARRLLMARRDGNRAQTFNAGISDAGSSAALTWAENGPEPGVVLTCDAGGYSRWPDGHVARSPFSQRVRPAGGG
jgi:hypothetical protein